MDVRIRTAMADDLDAIRDIYNHYVAHSTCTYQIEPETLEERRQWFAKRSDKHPAVVAESNGEIVGWGSLSVWNPRCGYTTTVEFSVYVRPDQHRRGIGRRIVLDLIERAKAAGHHAIIGGTSADQTASIALQESLGFKQVSHFPQIGRKFGRWLDVVHMVLLLDDAE